MRSERWLDALWGFTLGFILTLVFLATAHAAPIVVVDAAAPVTPLETTLTAHLEDDVTHATLPAYELFVESNTHGSYEQCTTRAALGYAGPLTCALYVTAPDILAVWMASTNDASGWVVTTYSLPGDWYCLPTGTFTWNRSACCSHAVRRIRGYGKVCR